MQRSPVRLLHHLQLWSTISGLLPQQHVLQLPEPAPLGQALLRSLLVLQQLLDVAGGAQQDVARGLHGEQGPPQKLPAKKTRGTRQGYAEKC